MKKNNERKGFTLIELLAVVAIISLLFGIGFVLISNIFNYSDDALNEIDKKLILNVVEQYTIEYRNSGNWKEDVDKDGISTSCVMIDSLINRGYFKENDFEISKYKDEYFVKIIIDKNGVLNYKLIDMDDIVGNCKYYIANVSSIDGGNSSISGGTSNDGYELTQKFSEVSENKFKMEINFSKDIYREEIAPLYVLFVLDVSGSMISNDKGGNAKVAIQNFGDDILKNITNSKIGFLPFETNANPQKFGDSYWTDDIELFKQRVKNVAYNGSNFYNRAYESIISDSIYDVSKLNEEGMIYIVLFSDAGDGPACYTSVNRDYVVNKISPNVDKFIFVAYTPSNKNCLSNFSSEINELYTDRSLHYLSTSSDVNDILSTISNKIYEETEYNNVEISIEIEKEFFKIEADDSWNVNHDTNTLKKIIDFSSFSNEELVSNLNFEIVYDETTKIEENKEGVAIIKNFVLKFLKKDGTVEIVQLEQSKLPKSSITTTEYSVVN